MRKYLISMIALVLMAALCAPAFADLTITNEEGATWGTKRIRMMNVAFDSSYASGGESLSYPLRHLANVDQVVIHNKGDFSFEYDKTNKKLKVYTIAPPLVYDEKITISATSGATLAYPAAFIFGVEDSSGNACKWMYSGVTTLTTNQFALNAAIADGERTGVTCDAADTYYVTYATQAWKDLYALLVQNEAVTLNAGSGASVSSLASGNTIFAFGCLRAGATTYTPIAWSDYPVAGEIGIEFGESGTSTSYLHQNQTNTATNAWITYLKKPASGTFLSDRFMSGVTMDGQTYKSQSGTSTAQLFMPGPILTWNISGYVPSHGDTTLTLNRAVTALASGKVKFKPTDFTMGAGADTYSTIYAYDFLGTSGVTPSGLAFTWGYPWEIPNVGKLEVPNGTDLSDLTDVKVIMIGR